MAEHLAVLIERKEELRTTLLRVAAGTAQLDEQFSLLARSFLSLPGQPIESETVRTYLKLGGDVGA